MRVPPIMWVNHYRSIKPGLLFGSAIDDLHPYNMLIKDLLCNSLGIYSQYDVWYLY